MQTPSDIYPSIAYQNAQAAIEWLCQYFGFTKRLVVDGPNNTVRHSELSLGTAVIMVSSLKGEQRLATPGTQSISITLYVENPDHHYQQALSGGAKIIQPLRDEEFGARGYIVQDPEGYHWYFGNYRPGAYWETKEGSP